MTHPAFPPRLVAAPPFEFLRERIRECRRRVLVASPYVNACFLALAQGARPDVQKSFITRTDLRYFASGASDLETLIRLMESGWTVDSVGGLHAKVYVLDDAVALITSANATAAGLTRNLECGVAVTAPDIVEEVATALRDWITAQEFPTLRTLLDLQELRQPVSILADCLHRIPQPSISSYAEEGDAFGQIVVEEHALLNGFSGWKRLVLRGVLTMPSETFSLDALLGVCEPVAAREYPENRHIREKLRQQLQLLRDLGLVEFKGAGVYRRTLTAQMRPHQA